MPKAAKEVWRRGNLGPPESCPGGRAARRPRQQPGRPSHLDVEEGSLVGALGSQSNGIIYGRRGTGKTHALKYLAETEKRKGNFVVYIDMEKRDLGSTEGLYGDPSLPVPERATRLLVMSSTSSTRSCWRTRSTGSATPRSRCWTACSTTSARSSSPSRSSGSTPPARSAVPVEHRGQGRARRRPPLDLSDKSTGKTTAQSRSKPSGRVRHRVQFGATSRLFQKVMDDHEAARCWLLFDEWSGIPLDLQPYLGEMLRRIFFASSKVSVRIAAIPHRTEWRISHAWPVRRAGDRRRGLPAPGPGRVCGVPRTEPRVADRAGSGLLQKPSPPSPVSRAHR